MRAIHERKLDDEQIREIREIVGKACPCCGKVVTQVDLAKKYDVSAALINMVIRRKRHFKNK